MFMNAGRLGSCHDQTCNKNQSEQFISYPCSFLALGPVGQPMKHPLGYQSMAGEQEEALRTDIPGAMPIIPSPIPGVIPSPPKPIMEL